MVIAWGEKDPWEPIALGKAYGEFDTVEDFIVLPNVGHCPQVQYPRFPNLFIQKDNFKRFLLVFASIMFGEHEPEF